MIMYVALEMFDYGFSENGLTAFKNGQQIYAGVRSSSHPCLASLPD